MIPWSEARRFGDRAAAATDLLPAREDRSASSRCGCPAADDATSVPVVDAFCRGRAVCDVGGMSGHGGGSDRRHLRRAESADCSMPKAASEPASGPASALVAAGSLRLFRSSASLIRATRWPGWRLVTLYREGGMAMFAFLRIEPKGPRAAPGVAGPGRPPDSTESTGRVVGFGGQSVEGSAASQIEAATILEPDSRRSVGVSIQREKSTIGSWRSAAPEQV